MKLALPQLKFFRWLHKHNKTRPAPSPLRRTLRRTLRRNATATAAPSPIGRLASRWPYQLLTPAMSAASHVQFPPQVVAALKVDGVVRLSTLRGRVDVRATHTPRQTLVAFAAHSTAPTPMCERCGSGRGVYVHVPLHSHCGRVEHGT